MPLGADTKKYLDEVKKGKPRKFAMVMKGEKILSLIVYKKGTVEKYKKQAKEEGQGQFYFGVVDGKGQDISFKLRMADGFDGPPGKDVKLKAFLAEEAGMKFKPAYQIVTELPGVDESDEEANAPPQAPPAAPPAPPEVTSEAFTARFKGLLPDLKKAQATAPLREQLTKLTAAAQQLGKLKRFADGMRVLDKLEEMVEQALALPPQAPPAPPGADSNGRAQWDAAREVVDGQISALQSALRSAKDPRLARIADQGLNGITGRLQVGVRTALVEYEQADAAGREALRKKLLKAIDDYQAFVQSNALVALIDSNPFGVKTSVRAMLSAGLSKLREYAEGKQE